MHKSWKAVAGICMLFAALFVSANAASAQECGGGGYFSPPCTDLLQFEYPATVNAGGPIAITGSITEVAAAVGDYDSVEFKIADQVVGSAPVRDDGTFSGSFTVPNVAQGDYTIVGTASADLTADGPIRILNAGSQVPTSPTNTANNGNTPLARTGFDATPMITLGAAALVLGAAAVYGSKRRQVA